MPGSWRAGPVETTAYALLEAVETGGDRHDVRPVTGGLVDLGEVNAERARVRTTRPLRNLLELSEDERGDLVEHVAGPEPERPGLVARSDSGGNAFDPEVRELAELE